MVEWYYSTIATSQEIAFFTPFAVTKLLQDGSSTGPLRGFAPTHYLTAPTWVLPLNWDNEVMPVNRIGNHWASLVVHRSNRGIVFLHIDSLRNNDREPAVESIVSEVLAHMSTNSAAPTEHLEAPTILHASKVRVPQQPGFWQCGYYMLHAIVALSTSRLGRVTLSYLSPDTLCVDLTSLFDGFGVSNLQNDMLKCALQASHAMMGAHVDPTGNGTWVLCTVNGEKELLGGTWRRLKVFSACGSGVHVWCKLANSAAWWRHDE